MDENDFCRCYGKLLSESVIPKVLDHSYVSRLKYLSTPFQLILFLLFTFDFKSNCGIISSYCYQNHVSQICNN